MIDKDKIQDYVIDFLTGEITEEDRLLLDSWLQASSENRDEFKRIQEIWASSIDIQVAKRFPYENAFKSFKKRRFNQRRSLFLRWTAVAAAVVLLTVGGFIVGNRHVNSSLTAINIEVPFGSRTMITLPDSSTVWLNAGSRLSYRPDFGVNNRNVELDGEGYFDVKHNDNKPFVVISEGIELTDLGTKFNISNYDEETEATISLIEGKASLLNTINDSAPVTLILDNRAILDKNSGMMTVSRHLTSNSKEWINGYIFFDEELMVDIARKLERAYNVKITFSDDAVKQQRFYGNFVRREQNIDEILQDLSSTGKLHYRKEGTNVVIY